MLNHKKLKTKIKQICVIEHYNTVVDMSNGIQYFNFYDTIESKLVGSLEQLDQISKISIDKKKEFKTLCKTNYEQFYLNGDIFDVTCRNDNALTT